MKEGFVHLHLHSQYSLLDGAIRFEELFPLVKKYGMKAVALTDHGNMFGAIEFYQGAISHGIKPIIGCEVYVAPGSRFERDAKGLKDAAYHLTLLIQDMEGYRNLNRLVSLAHLEGFYYKPRIDKELLEKYNGGLIALSGCLKGEIPHLLLQGQYEEAKRVASWFKEVFSGGRFYLEVQDNGLEEQHRINGTIFRLGKELGIKPVATNDCHYLRPEDAQVHDVLLCIQTGKTLKDPKRMKFSSEQFHLRSPQEMEVLFSSYPEALANTLEIAERCNLDLHFDTYHLPHFSPPEGESLDQYLSRLAHEGLEGRLKEGGKEKEKNRYLRRLREELDVINSMGFAGYFLIVADFVNYAKRKGIPVGPGRGSAAGSLVAYALGITDIDPLEYDLLFERFLNPERISLPDIDVDFCYEGRDEVIRYVTSKYGKEKVAQIITFGKMQAKAVVRDVGRVLDMPYKEVDLIAKLIPNTLNITLDQALKMEPRLRELTERDPQVAQLIGLARKLEGMVRHASTHAAGVVIANRPLTEYLPLYRGTGGEIVTQYAMKDVEKIGLVKFDFLGLKTLTIMKKAVQLIKETRGVELDLGRLPLNDRKTLRLLAEGDTTGVFQLESSGMRELLRKLKPSSFKDLIALVALYRPGPLGSGMVEEFIKRRHKKAEITYEHPALKRILEDTYGVIVYQEQVMMIASRLADFSLGEADILRRAMSKKDPEEMEKLKERFIAGATKKGLSEEKAREIFEKIAKFAEYGFNKSHSTAYAMIAYQTAYLKAHFPQEFMAALLTCDMDNSDKVMRYVGECREKGIEILPPDVNQSEWGFTVEGGERPRIRYGLGAIKNVGAGAVEAIVEERRRGGAFKDLFDFCERVDSRKVNRRVIESLIKAGAFSSTGANRSQLMAVLDEAMEWGARNQKEKKSKQPILFAGLQSRKEKRLPEMEEWTEGQILSAEKQVFGFYFTSHPFSRFQKKAHELTSLDTEALEELESGKLVRVAGVTSEVKELSTKKGERMARLVLEDLKGRVEVIVFPDLYQKSRLLLGDESPLLVEAILEKDDDGRPRLRARELFSLEEVKEVPAKRVSISLRADGIGRDHLLGLARILKENRGDCKAYLRISFSSKEVTVSLPFGLAPTEELKKSVEGFLGYRAVEWE